MMTVDPLSLQVFANLFASVAEQMGVTLQRAAFSPNIKMRRDYSCALFDDDGRLLAQAAHIPVHLGAMPIAMETIQRRFDLERGDVIIMNDPYEGGTHLPDVSLISRAFTEEGDAIGYVMSRAHHADIGGMSPGSMPLATEVFQEGMIIPPIYLRRAGAVQKDVLDLILRNVRTPVERRGDFEAQLATQDVGEQGLRDLSERYGLLALRAHGTALLEQAERGMRAFIAAIPPGRYTYRDHLDSDGRSPGPVVIQCSIAREASSTDLHIDFSGSDSQRSGGVNAPRAVTTAAVLYVLRCLQGQDSPINGGSLTPLHIDLPRASVVAAEAPAAVAAGNVETSQRITDVVFGALAVALPDRVPAASQGTMNNLAFGGWDPERRRHFAYYETLGGGMGARPGQDGLDAVHDHMSNTLNTPVEVLESEYPVRMVRYRLRSGSGGQGLYRGGQGVVRTFRFLSDVRATVLSDRRTSSPFGLRGGADGANGENLLTVSDVATPVADKADLDLQADAVLEIHTPGGGGWGVLPESELHW